MVVALGFFWTGWLIHGSVSWILIGACFLLLFVGLAHSLLENHADRSRYKTELRSASVDKLLTEWRGRKESEQVVPSPPWARRFLARQRRPVERELRRRGLVPPEQL
jgi:hypothetical protein